jgi:hypothetical protein
VNVRRAVSLLTRAAVAALGVWLLGWLVAGVSSEGIGFSPDEVPSVVWLLAEVTLLVAFAYGLVRHWEE